MIGSLTGTMAKRFLCNVFGKGCERGAMHTCDQTCIECMASPPCVRQGFESRALNVMDIFAASHVSPTTS
jgi:hypothetical protein